MNFPLWPGYKALIYALGHFHIFKNAETANDHIKTEGHTDCFLEIKYVMVPEYLIVNQTYYRELLIRLRWSFGRKHRIYGKTTHGFCPSATRQFIIFSQLANKHISLLEHLPYSSGCTPWAFCFQKWEVHWREHILKVMQGVKSRMAELVKISQEHRFE